jgi:plasmid stabilization system protein ParE
MMPKNKMQLIYSEEIDAHLDRLSAFLVDKGGAQTAFDVIGELIDGIDKLREMPHTGSPHPNPTLAARGYYTLFLGRYVCIYLIDGNVIWVGGVFHQKTDWVMQFDSVQGSADKG